MYKKYKPVWKQVESFASQRQQEYSSTQKLAEIIHLDSGTKLELAHLDLCMGCHFAQHIRQVKERCIYFQWQPHCLSLLSCVSSGSNEPKH